MSIMDLFRVAPQAPVGQAPMQPNTPNTQQVATASGMNAAPTTDGKMPGTDQTPANPLDVYAKLFQDAANGTPSAPPALRISPDVLNNVTQNMNFTDGIDPELMQKATNGDAKAMIDIIQAVGRNSYRAAMDHGTALTDTFINQRQGFDNTRVAAGVRQQLTQAELANTPNYNHPVVKAELNRVAAQFARANPDMSPAEVAKTAQEYINNLSLALNPQKPDTQNSESTGELDWSKYLSS